MTTTNTQRPLILVVDDSPVNRTLTAAQLNRLGYDVHLTASGEEGLAFLDHSNPALVLLDWHMPPPDGLETARRIRVREAAENRIRMPLVALTAQAMIGDRERCLTAGMDDFLSRPVRLADLKRVLGLWIDRVEPAPQSVGLAPDNSRLSRVDTGAADSSTDQSGSLASHGIAQNSAAPNSVRANVVSTGTQSSAAGSSVVHGHLAPTERSEPVNEKRRTAALPEQLKSVVDPGVLDALNEELGDLELVHRLVTTYIQELPVRIEGVLATNAPLEQRRSLHTLKTTSAMVGGFQLARLAARLEADSLALGTAPTVGITVSETSFRTLAEQTLLALEQQLQVFETSPG